jgi:tetratricopeptide (TPR) repeat protein
MQVIAGADFSRRRRGPFLSSIETVVLAGVVAVLLFWLFPGRDFQDPRHLAKPDHLSIAYLNMLLRAHPEDADARLLLTQQHMALGHVDEALEALAPLRGRTDEVGGKAEVLALKLDRSRLAAMLPGELGRDELEQEVRRVAHKLIPQTTRPDDLADLADFVLALGEPAVAARAYLRLAELDRKRRIGWLEKGARWTEASGQPSAAARLYAQAALSTEDEALGARLGREALRALRSANEGKPALALAKAVVDRHPRNLELLAQAIQMAVATRDLSSARRWAEQRVQAAGSTDEALREQADILTKAGDPEEALRVTKVLLGRAPGNTQLRKQVGQLARWSSQPELALEQYAWLARRGSEEHRLKAVDLARALNDTDREVEMIELRVNQARRMAAPTVPEFEQLRRLEKKIGKPKKAPKLQPRVAPFSPRRRPLDPPFPPRRWSLDSPSPPRRWSLDSPSPRSDGERAGVRGVRARDDDGRPARRAPLTLSLSPSERGEGTRSGRSRPVGRLRLERGPALRRLAQDAQVAPAAAAPVKAAAPPKPAAKASVSDLQLAELISLADALEAKGLPERAVSAMDSFRFNFADKPEYWSRLARLYEYVGELERALACHEQLARLKAMSLDESIRQAEILWRLQRPDAALTRLVALRGQARETDSNYWRLLGELAWRLENDLLAAEAFSLLWKRDKLPDIADRLWRSLNNLGRRDEAIGIAEQAYDATKAPGFLVSAADLAARSGNWDRMRALFRKVEGQEKRFARESQFWFQRAQLSVHDDRPGEAERDFQRVLSIDAQSDDAHIEWLTLAVHVQDRGMARRALDHWGPRVEADRDNWWLLSDAYLLLGDGARAARWKRMARAARAQDRAASGRPLTPEEEIEEAIERRDKPGIDARLRTHGHTLSLPVRVAALRELGRDEDAWSLLEAAGLTQDKALIGSEDAAALVADVRDLRENYLSGAWAWGDMREFGGLEMRTAGARLELRTRALLVGLEVAAGDLAAPTRPQYLYQGTLEQRAHLVGKLRERFGETSLRAGAEFLPEGYRPSLSLGQLISLKGGRFEVRVEGSFNDLPTHSSLLRVAGLRDGIDGDMLIGLPGYLELEASSSVSRLMTRSRLPLTHEISGRGALAFRLPVGSAFFRPRVDLFRNGAPPLTSIPEDLEPFLSDIMGNVTVDPEDVLALQYTALGVGVSIGSTHGEVGEGRGPHVSLRYHLDAWAGHMWPASRASYSLEAGLGLVFARHQELAVSGFYFTDVGSAPGERYAGATLNYTLRWFR